MLWIPLALGTEAPPLPALRPARDPLLIELRAGHAVTLAPTFRDGAWNYARYGPNAHGRATLGIGFRFARVIGSITAGGARFRRTGDPRFRDGEEDVVGSAVVAVQGGLRVDAPRSIGLFASVEIGAALEDVKGVTAVAALGWTGPGARFRPVVAVEGRPNTCSHLTSNPGYTLCPASPGVYVNAGVRVSARRPDAG